MSHFSKSPVCFLLNLVERHFFPFFKKIDALKHWVWGDIEECSDEDVFMREEYWIKTHLKEGMKVLNVTHAGEKIEKKNRANKKYGSIMGGKNVWKSKNNTSK